MFVCLFGILFLKQSQNIRQALLCLSSSFSSKDLCKIILNTSFSTSFFTALISYQGRLIDSAPLKSALWERSAVRSEELTFLPTIAGMFISPDGPDKMGSLLFYGFSKQKSTICNDLGDREHIQERIFYTYLVICRGSSTRLRKGFYKATFFFFSMIYQKTKTNDPLSLRKQNTNIKEVTGLVKNDSSLSGKKDSGEGGCSSTRKSVWIWTLGPGMQVTLYVNPLRLSFSHQVTTVYWLLH